MFLLLLLLPPARFVFYGGGHLAEPFDKSQPTTSYFYFPHKGPFVPPIPYYLDRLHSFASTFQNRLALRQLLPFLEMPLPR